MVKESLSYLKQLNIFQLYQFDLYSLCSINKSANFKEEGIGFLCLHLVLKIINNI